MRDARKTSETSDKINPSRVNHFSRHILPGPQSASCALLRPSNLYCLYCFYYSIEFLSSFISLGIGNIGIGVLSHAMFTSPE
ncbi:hypothetical protein TGAM01_v202189 [Trichoderma gamsii]|uniref:Uncharacterized protein n=1 Tax=Trichoderma gamsii TaxID=398673 RepID=A0A2P4ZXU0_9HYPO|nr:hypothetical protein TGAM01_v202189 [Trichoderma gamsii]PON29081.1 hypothetical protein TGAM01_v202189 [Trichoderma gamsii]